MLTTACNFEVRALGVYFRCEEYLLGLDLVTMETFAVQRSRRSLSSFTNTLIELTLHQYEGNEGQLRAMCVTNRKDGPINVGNPSLGRKKNFHQNKLKKKTATKLTPRNAPQQRAYMMRADLLHCPITSMKRTLSFQWSNSSEIENFASVLINNMI